MSFNPFGRITSVKLLQPMKTPYGMFVTLSGMITEVKPLQFLKVSAPIFVTPSGMTTDVKAEQPSKALE